MERWEGKVAVVTGASKGIGNVMVRTLIEKGLKVVGISRNADSRTQVDGKFYVVRADLRKEEDIVKSFEWILATLGPVSVLVNNAAAYGFSLLLDGDGALWKDVFDTNVIGLCLATREAVRQMRTHDIDGHVVHIGSLYAHKIIVDNPMNVYQSSKCAVRALTETLRQELNSINSKIKISCVSPSLTRTEFVNSLNLSDPTLECGDVVDAVCYVLGTPPHVQIHELTLRALGSSV